MPSAYKTVFISIAFACSIAASKNVLPFLDLYELPWDPSVIQDERCRSHVQYWLDGLQLFVNASLQNCEEGDQNCTERVKTITSQTEFAAKQLDSFGKVPSDLLNYNSKWQGSWDECIAVTSSPDYRTKFCWIDVSSDLLTAGLNYANAGCNAPFKIQWSVCMPRSCSDQDIGAFMATLNNSTSGYLQFCTAKCRPSSVSTNDARFWIVLGVYCIPVAALLIIASLLDFVVQQWPDNPTCQRLTKDLAGRILMTFSIYANGAALLNTVKRPGQIISIDCIRTFSMTWVMIGHLLSQFMGSDNPLQLLDITKPVLNDAFINAFLCVDSFLFVGGLLLAYLFYKDMDRNPRNIKNPVFWILYYVHRILRLSPPYFFFLGFYIAMYPYLTVGPRDVEGNIELCKRHWWYNVLYINNLINKEQCLGHTWYLALDMQVHIFAPILLVPLFFTKIGGLIVSLALLVISVGATYGTYYKYDFPATVIGLYISLTTLDPNHANAYFHWIYNPPWIRFTPYMIGILTGYFLNKKRNQNLRLHWVLVLALWLISTAVALACIFGLYEYMKGKVHLSTFANASYYTWHRIGWALALAWVVIACQHNLAGPVKSFMELGLWMPLGRLTYCAYLVHVFIIDVILAQERHPLHYSTVMEVYVHLGFPLFVTSYLFAFVWSCTFELPFGRLEKLATDALLGSRNWKAPEEVKPKS